MTAATLLYQGDVSGTTAIISAVGTNPADDLIIIPESNGLQVSIYLEGSP